MRTYLTNSDNVERIRQGDIFSNVPYFESYNESGGEFEVTIYRFPYVVVLTQDCDLEQNKNTRLSINKENDIVENDKHLFSLLVAPLYNSEHLISGEHLKEIGISSQRQNTKLKDPIIKNQNARYHYIEFSNDVVIPNSIIDFKHYFSISLDYMEEHMENRICGINPIYRELVSQRFSNYLSRIGLP